MAFCDWHFHEKLKTMTLLRGTIRMAVWCSAVALTLGCTGQAATNRFGFNGPEIFPIDSQISLLHAADLDGDGLNDLVVVNNARSKINLLLQPNRQDQRRRGEDSLRARSASRMNCRPTRAFGLSPSPRRNASPRMVVTDLNGDDRSRTSPTTAIRRN